MQNLIISSIVSGTLAFLGATAIIYYIDKQPLNDSIRIGLIVGISFPIVMELIMRLFDFLGI